MIKIFVRVKKNVAQTEGIFQSVGKLSKQEINGAN